MSKTDKTRPYWVKVRDKASYLVENHDHRDGVCNLPERPTPHNRADYNWAAPWQSGDCQWITSAEFWSSPDALCPCKMCHGSYGWEDGTSARAQRRKARRYSRDGWRDEY